MLKTILTGMVIAFVGLSSEALTSYSPIDLQNRVDSFTSTGNFESAIALINATISEQEKTKSSDDSRIYFLMTLKASVYFMAGDWSQTEAAFDQVIEYAVHQPALWKRLFDDTYLYVYYLLTKTRQFSTADKYRKVVNKLANSMRDQESVRGANSLNLLYYGTLIQLSKDEVYFDSSLHFLHERMAFLEADSNFNDVFKNHIEIAKAQYGKGKYQEALTSCKSAEQILPRTDLSYRERLKLDSIMVLVENAVLLKKGVRSAIDSSILTQTDPSFRARQYQEIAWLFIEEEEYEQALNICKDLEVYYDRTGELYPQGATAQLLGKIFARTHQDSLSTLYLTKAFELLMADGRYNEKIIGVLADYSTLPLEFQQGFEELGNKAIAKFEYDKDSMNLEAVHRSMGSFHTLNGEVLDAARHFEISDRIKSAMPIVRDKYYPAKQLLEALNLIQNGAYQEAKPLFAELVKWENRVDPAFNQFFFYGMHFIGSKIKHSESGRLAAIQYIVEQLDAAKSTKEMESLLSIIMQFNPGTDLYEILKSSIEKYENQLNGEAPADLIVLLYHEVIPGFKGEISKELEPIDIGGTSDIPLNKKYQLMFRFTKVIITLKNNIEDPAAQPIGIWNRPEFYARNKASIDTANVLLEKLTQLLLSEPGDGPFSDRFERMNLNAQFWLLIRIVAIFKNDVELLLLADEATQNFYGNSLNRLKELFETRSLLSSIREQMGPEDLLFSFKHNDYTSTLDIIAIAKQKIYQYGFHYSQFMPDSAIASNFLTDGIIPTQLRGIIPPASTPRKNDTKSNSNTPEISSVFNFSMGTLRNKLASPNASERLTDSDLKLMENLYQLLFLPVLKNHPEVSRISISATGQLAVFPFDLLPADGKTLVSLYPITRRQHLLGIASPTKLSDSNRNIISGKQYFDDVSQATPAPCKFFFSTTNARRQEIIKKVEKQNPLSCYYKDWILHPLPGASKEASQVADILSEEEPEFIQLSEHDLKSEALSNDTFNVIHLATHAIYHPTIPELSAVVLDSGKGEDGFLTLLEVAGLHLNSKLVVLSACETNLGHLYDFTGSFGLSQAFLNAGANQVVSSLWKVDDAATTLWMIEFYQHLKASDFSDASQSVYQTKLKFMSGEMGEHYSDPYYWAGFTLME